MFGNGRRRYSMTFASKDVFRRQMAVQLDKPRNNAGPTGLMTGP